MSDKKDDRVEAVSPDADAAPTTKPELPDTTDENGLPVDNPSG